MGYEKCCFPADRSHNSRATVDEKKLYAKYVIPAVPIGEDGGHRYDSPLGRYTASEIAILRPIRDSILPPKDNTVMQKIVTKETMEKSFLKKPLNIMNSVVVWGFVSAANDVVPFSKSTIECYENCRLDYKGTEFTDPNEAVYAIRFCGKPSYYIPYSSEFTDINPYDHDQPFTGSGYIGAKSYVIPEYRIFDNKQIIPSEGEIYKIFADGHEELYATYDKRRHVFRLI